MYAARNGHKEIVKVLLCHGADVGAQNIVSHCQYIDCYDRSMKDSTEYTCHNYLLIRALPHACKSQQELG